MFVKPLPEVKMWDKWVLNELIAYTQNSCFTVTANLLVCKVDKGRWSVVRLVTSELSTCYTTENIVLEIKRKKQCKCGIITNTGSNASALASDLPLHEICY